MRVSTHLSIDPSPPYRMTEAANDIQLAAFFIGESTGYVAKTYSDLHVCLHGALVAGYANLRAFRKTAKDHDAERNQPEKTEELLHKAMKLKAEGVRGTLKRQLALEVPRRERVKLLDAVLPKIEHLGS